MNQKGHLYFLMAILFATAALSMETPQERLLAGVQLFDKGHYDAALRLLSTIDVRKDLDNSDDMKLALKIRAISFSETGDIQGSAESIRELYFLDPNYRFDAFDTPSEVVELASKELKIIEEKNQRFALIKPTSEPIIAEPKPIVEKIISQPKNNLASTLFPFGINHYLVNRPIKGSIYLSLQTASLVANIGCFWWKQSYLTSFGASRLENPANKNGFATAQTFQYIALGAFVTALGASIVDALIDYIKSSSQNEPLFEISS